MKKIKAFKQKKKVASLESQQQTLLGLAREYCEYVKAKKP